MVGRKRAPADGTHKALPQNPGQADLNQIVAYNFRQARELRGWTQDEAAIGLEPLLGQRLPQASISALERAYEGDRRESSTRRNPRLRPGVQLAFGMVLPPAAWRPPHARAHDQHSQRALWGRVWARRPAGPVYDRLRQLGIDEPGEVDKAIENITGKASRVRQTSYQQRRKEMLLALLDQYSDDVDRAADEMGAFFDHLRQVGVRGFVAERLDDPDYVYRPRTKKPRRTTRD